MPNIMFREHDGGLWGYIAKRDLEARVQLIEFDGDDQWGGRIELEDGQAFYLDPLDKRPSLPATLRLRKADE